MRELNTIYSPAQVAGRVDLSQSSIRRYTIALENAGYPNIKRSKSNHRRYDLYDIKVLEHFKNLVKEKHMSFDGALEQTMNDLEYIKTKVEVGSENESSKTTQRSDIEQLETKINVLIKMVQELNVKTESLQKDNERLTDYIKEQQLVLESEEQRTESDIDPAEEDNQTNIYDYIETSGEETEVLETGENTERNSKEKMGVFSRIKKWFS